VITAAHVDFSRDLWYHLSVATHQFRWARDGITREDTLRDLSKKLVKERRCFAEPMCAEVCRRRFRYDLATLNP
jgi:hypothetical protein